MSGTFDDMVFLLGPGRHSILASLKSGASEWWREVNATDADRDEIIRSVATSRTKTEMLDLARLYSVALDRGCWDRERHADVAYEAARTFVVSTFPEVRACATMNAEQRAELAARAIPAAVEEAFTRHRYPVVFLREVLPEVLFPGDGPGVAPLEEAPHEVDAATASCDDAHRARYVEFTKRYSETWRATPTRAARAVVNRWFVDVRDAAKRYAEAETLSKRAWVCLERRATLERTYIDNQYLAEREFRELAELWRPPAV